jgi:hypothetical protein
MPFLATNKLNKGLILVAQDFVVTNKRCIKNCETTALSYLVYEKERYCLDSGSGRKGRPSSFILFFYIS